MVVEHCLCFWDWGCMINTASKAARSWFRVFLFKIFLETINTCVFLTDFVSWKRFSPCRHLATAWVLSSPFSSCSSSWFLLRSFPACGPPTLPQHMVRSAAPQAVEVPANGCAPLRSTGSRRLFHCTATPLPLKEGTLLVRETLF